MPDIDFGAALDFIDTAEGTPRQLRFQRNWAPPDDPRVFDGTGQLVAVIAAADIPTTATPCPSAAPALTSTTSNGSSRDGKTGPN